MADHATKSSHEDNINGTLESRRAAHQLGQQMQSTTVDQFQTFLNICQPMFQAQSIWAKAWGDGLEAAANKIRQETNKLTQYAGQ